MILPAVGNKIPKDVTLKHGIEPDCRSKDTLDL